MAISGEFFLPQVGRTIQSLTSDTNWDRTQIDHDDSHWDTANVTFYFEVVASNSDSSDRFIRLRDKAGTTTFATITIPASTTSLKRFRSTSFSLASGNETYWIQVEGTTSSAQILCYQGGILAVASSATAVVPRIMLCHFYNQGTSQDSFITRHNTATFLTPSHSTIGSSFTLNKSNWGDTISTWGLGVEWRGFLTSQNGDIQLYNETDATAVTASLINANPDHDHTYSETTFADSATNWDDGDTFWFQYRRVSGSSFIEIYRVEIFCRLTSASKAESHFMTCHARGNMTTDTVHDEYRHLYTAASWSTVPELIHEIQASYTSGSSFEVEVVEDTDDDGAPTSPLLSGAQIVVDSSFVAGLSRVASLTPSDTTRYLNYLNEIGTTTIVFSGSKLIYVISATPVVDPGDSDSDRRLGIKEKLSQQTFALLTGIVPKEKL